VTAQVGPAAGLLSGDTVIGQIQSELRQIVSQHTAGGTVHSLADLGVAFSATGEASFDQTTFDGLTDQQVADGFAFAGSATSGLGGFAGSFSQISDPISGLIKVEQDGFDRTDHSLQTQMAALNDRITTMTASLNSKLQAADALLATLQSQQQTLTASLQGLNVVLYGKNQNQ
jgi:flagellar capping protein FliD